MRMFENRMLWRIFRPKMEEVVGGWRRLHNKEIHYLCTSPNIIRVKQSRWVKWVEHVACVGEIRKALKYFGLKT
jgi:hypothetical protein